MKTLLPFVLFIPVYFSNAQDTFKIAFGSCSHQDRPQVLWTDIVNMQPDWWLWLGDNIYGDTEDMNEMSKIYNQQKSNQQYQELLRFVQVDGTWDDHDYGVNDGGEEFSQKEASQQLLLDFLDIPKDHPRRLRAGVYGNRIIEWRDVSINLIILDTRYHRSPINDKGQGTILGKDQWRWLEETLKTSESDLHVILSSIQVIPEDHKYEKWVNFPTERQRLFDLLVENKVSHPVFLSGDRHIGEISVMEHNGLQLVDVTSSSLTHTWNQKKPEKNRHRYSTLVGTNNYGLLTIEHTEDGQWEAKVALIGTSNELLAIYAIR